jgi:hypothetical protein
LDSAFALKQIHSQRAELLLSQIVSNLHVWILIYSVLFTTAFAVLQEIKQYVSAFKYDLNLPEAALHLQTAWRARGPRLLLKRYPQAEIGHTLLAW